MKFAPSLIALSLALAAVAAGAQTTAPAAPALTAAQTLAPTFEAAGQAAAAAWLARLDSGQFGQAWDESSKLFRTAVPLASWMEGMPKSRGALGVPTGRKLGEIEYKSTLQGQPDGAYVSVLFVTSFAGKPDVDEIVTTMREPDGKFRVTGYSTR